jgi:hypothetical protein
MAGETSYDPPPALLQQNRTYYWRVEGVRHGEAISSPLWSFSTEGEVAVEHTTWGRIKALYR